MSDDDLILSFDDVNDILDTVKTPHILGNLFRAFRRSISEEERSKLRIRIIENNRNDISGFQVFLLPLPKQEPYFISVFAKSRRNFGEDDFENRASVDNSVFYCLQQYVSELDDRPASGIVEIVTAFLNRLHNNEAWCFYLFDIKNIDHWFMLELRFFKVSGRKNYSRSLVIRINLSYFK